jgi:hypothetical protein
MKQTEMASVMNQVFKECDDLRGAGQKDYAGEEKDAFANFDRLALDLGIDRKKILWVYAMKHRDGIANFLNGHTSQREDVRGRINDLIVYMCLLRGMIEEEERNSKMSAAAHMQSQMQGMPGPGLGLGGGLSGR